MSVHHKPYAPGKIFAVGLAVAVLFSLLSLFFLFLQANNVHNRQSGEVISLSANKISIRNARGKVTELSFASDIKLRGVTSLSELAPGIHIMTRGEFTDSGTFEVDRLRIIKEPGPK